jgi:flagellar biosynthesis/type III secretory pathway protein FliH
MERGTYEYQREFARKYVARGRQLGREEGLELGRAEGRQWERLELGPLGPFMEAQRSAGVEGCS